MYKFLFINKKFLKDTPRCPKFNGEIVKKNIKLRLVQYNPIIIKSSKITLG